MMRLVVVAVGVVAWIAAEPVRGDCSNPGGSEGFEQCQKYPSCDCRSEVESCPGGGWFTRYRVVEPCPAMSPPTPSPTRRPRRPRPLPPELDSGPPSSPTPPRRAPPTTPRDKQCQMMSRWLEKQRQFLEGYRDDALLAEAVSKRMTPAEYNLLLWQHLHPGEAVPSGGGGIDLMATGATDCKIKHIKSGCQWLLDQGLPRYACYVALTHEQIHVRQCQDGIADTYELGGYRDREAEAYEHDLREIQKWMDRNCRR